MDGPVCILLLLFDTPNGQDWDGWDIQESIGNEIGGSLGLTFVGWGGGLVLAV